MGQKPKITKSQLLEALEKTGGIITATAQVLGVSRRAIQYRLKQDPSLKEAQEDEREKFIDICEGRLRKAVNDGDMKAVYYALDNLAKDRGYGRRNVDVTSLGESVAPVSNKTREQLIRELELRMKNLGYVKQTNW